MSEDSDQNATEQFMGLVDELIRDSKRKQAWIDTLLERVILLEAKASGGSPKEVLAQLKERQKFHLQRIFERIEKKDPSLAAELDNREVDDIL